MTTTSGQRRLGMLVLATGGWLACFAALARLGTWAPFAFVGVTLAVAALAVGAVSPRSLRPSARTVGLGLVVGVLMVAATELGYGVVAAWFPAVRPAAERLFGLLVVGGYSRASRAALIVLVASCEEVLFRGPLVREPRGNLARVAGLSVVYAVAMAPLGSGLLLACAFACGIVWGALRAATDSLVPPIVAHVVWDLGVLVLWPLAS